MLINYFMFVNLFFTVYILHLSSERVHFYYNVKCIFDYYIAVFPLFLCLKTRTNLK